MATSNPPRRHHYVPELYLRQWVNEANGLLHRYAVENGVVRLRLRSPRSVGYRENLYRAPYEHLTEWQAQALETHFFGPMDDDAASALHRLLSGDLALDGWRAAERQGWVMFLRSLRIRSPHGIENSRSTLRSIFETSLANLEADYERRRTPSDPPTFDEFKALLHPDYPERAVFNSIAHAINSPKVGLKLLNTHWEVIDVASAGYTLLISDAEPAYHGLDLPNGHILMPISPTKIFVVTTDPQFLESLRRCPENVLVRAINQRVVGDAREFVVATDNRQSVFISNRFGMSVPH